MRDGKKIIFTKHAQQRAFERFHTEYLVLQERFKAALRYDDNFWIAIYIAEEDIPVTYIVAEHPRDFTIITVY